MLLSAAYDPAITPVMVEMIKAQVPQHARRYLPDTHEWFIGSAYLLQALALFRQCFPDAEVIHDGGSPPPRDDTPRPLADATHYATLHLLPSAPRELIQAAYKVLAKTLHPDRLPVEQRTQGHAQMCAINAAYEALHVHTMQPMEAHR
jgi:hypothetical protein